MSTSPKDYLTDRVKKKILSIIKNYAGEGNDDFVNKLVALLTNEVEKYYIQGYMDSFEPDNGEMPDGSLSIRQIKIMTKQAKGKLEQRKALSDIGGEKI